MPFACNKVNATVNFKYKDLILREGIGVIGALPMKYVDCDHKSECGVETAAGVDWSKCVCPESRRRRSR